MLRRLVLALLVLSLAAPAVAAQAHCTPAQGHVDHTQHVAATDGEQTHRHDPQPAQTQQFGQKVHDCIGCGVPQLDAPAVPGVMFLPAAPAAVRLSTLAEPRPARPETPPPRI